MGSGIMWLQLLCSNYMLVIMLRFFKAFRAQPRLAIVTESTRACIYYNVFKWLQKGRCSRLARSAAAEKNVVDVLQFQASRFFGVGLCN